MNRIIPFLCIMICAVYLSGCATAEPEKEAHETTEEEKTAEEPEEKEEKAAEPLEEDLPLEEEPLPEEDVLPEAENKDAEEEEYQVSEELYQQTFDDVESLINELNEIIQRKDYSTWLSYLTREYREKYSDPNVLKELSNQPTLRKYDITLNSLKDYFTYVVAPSRANAKLDDLVFEDKNHVKAIMEIKGNRVILYLLEKVNGQWKIAPKDDL